MTSLKLTFIPPGLKLFPRIHSPENRAQVYRTSVLLLTFLAYAILHASRKPPSVVKNVLSGYDSLLMHNTTSTRISFTGPSHMIYSRRVDGVHAINRTISSGWAPFNGTSGTALLGDVDVAFLASYSIGMYIAGHLGDRLNLSLFLSGGMIGSGILVSLFGLAFWWNVHWLGYFLIVQILAGFMQATGWPSVVTVVGNWFGKEKRGLIMGVWNAHTSVGNIWGTLMASSVLKYGWGWSFVVPGVATIVGGVAMFLFLAVDPRTVGLSSPYEASFEETMEDEEKGCGEGKAKLTADSKKQPLLHNGYDEEEEENAVGFFQAWAIPGVAPFAFCLFFAKLVAYTFLYWLPFYIEHTAIDGEYLSDATAGNLSTVFDIGGTIGGILAGYISDRMNSRAIVASSFTFAALPTLLLYRMYGSQMLWLNALLLFLTGICVNGPYALITTAVAADLGTHDSLKGNARALATVTAIIDGTGSVGAALGPLITGYISNTGWNSVFIMLISSATLSGLLLTRLVAEEFRAVSANWKLRICKQRELA